MHKSTSPGRKSFRLYAIVSSALIGVGAAAALAAGITPATAASLARNADTQVAVFMIPLTLLVLTVLLEVTRIALRGALPAEATPRRRSRLDWKPGNGEG
ncbi:hypothetical protein [uncultured Devosia sp.]|uniref:hypothetical protein n=1 Tax=uncultured Devosia sp. TaxID=211434 RepID=UPI0035CB81AD